MNSAPVILASGNSILSVDGSFLFIFLLIILRIFVINRTLFRPITRDYESHIRAARAAAYQQMEARRRELKAHRLELLAAARKEAEAQLASARTEIAAQSAAARSTLEKDAREMAANISTQLLRRPVSPGGIGAS